MTEDDYISQLRAGWPHGPEVCEASLEVLALVDAAVRAFPQSARLWVMRGNLIQLGSKACPYSLAESLASYQQAVEIDPQFPEAWEEMGYYHDVILSDESAAEKYFREAERLRKQAEAEQQSQRLAAAQEVRHAIEVAFAGVTLEGGIGLWEAQGLDDYADAKTCAAYRANDEKDDWHRVPAEALNYCNSSLSFFDAEGMRFHLPAYLLAVLRGDYRFDITFCLTQTGDYDRYFGLLSLDQHRAVRAFLLHILDEPDYEFDRPHILHALDEYWTIR